jgi:hypothetical protein
MSNSETPGRVVTKDIPKTVEEMLFKATVKHKRLSLALFETKKHIALLQQNQEKETVPAFLRKVQKPECKLTNFASTIEEACNDSITKQHKKYVSDCMDTILDSRQKELENIKTCIQNVEIELTSEVEDYLQKVKETQTEMYINPEEANRKINTENTRIKGVLTKEFKNITTNNLRKISLEKTNRLIEKERISKMREEAREVVVVENTSMTMEKLIEKKVKAALSNKLKKTLTSNGTTKPQPKHIAPSKYNQSPKPKPGQNNVGVNKHKQYTHKPGIQAPQRQQQPQNAQKQQQKQQHLNGQPRRTTYRQQLQSGTRDGADKEEDWQSRRRSSSVLHHKKFGKQQTTHPKQSKRFA